MRFGKKAAGLAMAAVMAALLARMRFGLRRRALLVMASHSMHLRATVWPVVMSTLLIWGSVLPVV